MRTLRMGPFRRHALTELTAWWAQSDIKAIEEDLLRPLTLAKSGALSQVIAAFRAKHPLVPLSAYEDFRRDCPVRGGEGAEAAMSPASGCCSADGAGGGAQTLAHWAVRQGRQELVEVLSAEPHNVDFVNSDFGSTTAFQVAPRAIIRTCTHARTHARTHAHRVVSLVAYTWCAVRACVAGAAAAPRGARVRPRFDGWNER
jgi:hypothetical protein